MKYDPNINVPMEIMEAVRAVENWMGERGHRKWKLLGIQPREGDIPDNYLTRGYLIRVSFWDMTPTVEIMATDVDREMAKLIFWKTSASLNWIGPKQALFIHCSGYVEVWSE